MKIQMYKYKRTTVQIIEKVQKRTRKERYKKVQERTKKYRRTEKGRK